MKESKFIELLNLYIDHQISQEEAARLEDEIQQNPERRRTYNQYCRMQRACTLVLDQFAAPAAAGHATGRIAGFAPAEKRPRWGYYAAGLAAAAGIALVATQGFLHSGGSPAQARIPAAPRSDIALASAISARVSAPPSPEAPSIRLPARTERFIDEQLRVILPGSSPDSPPLAVASLQRPAGSVVPAEVPPAVRSPRPSIEQFVFGSEPPISETPRIFRNRQQTEEEAYKAALEYHR